MKTLTLATTVVLLVSLCSTAFSQQPDNQRERERNQQDSLQRQRQQNVGRDRQGDQQKEALVNYFAGKLMLMNDSTIEMSELARQKTSSSEVKQFAQKVAQEHQQMNQKLRECAPEMAQFASSDRSRRHTAGFRGSDTADPSNNQNRNRSDAADRRSDRRIDNQRADRREARRTRSTSANRNRSTNSGAGSEIVHQILNIERQTADNYTQSATQMLQRHQEQDFDMGYLGFQIGAHTWALAELKSLNSIGDQEFQQVVNNATSSMEQHLQEAKQLAEKFENDRLQNRSSGR